MRTLIAAAMAVTLCLPAFAAARAYPCHRASAPPVIDGEILAEPIWKAVPSATGFSVLGGGFALAKQTAVRACWDDQALYLAFVCEEPDVAAIKFSIADGGEAWLDDGVEIFLQPGGPGRSVYQLVITARGARTCGTGSPDFTKVQVATRTGPDFYCLEMRVPHPVVSAQPRLGDLWGANFCRNIFTRMSGGHQFTSWAPLTRQFNEPENFGALTLAGPPPPTSDLDAITNRINADYRGHLLTRIREVLAVSPEYAPVLREASRDADYSREARDVRRRWKRLERAASSAEIAPTSELRAVALDAGDLLDASYQCKWGYLKHKLLRDN